MSGSRAERGPGTGRFDGKVALVTGAGSGLGEAIAHKYAAGGARVILGDVSGRQDDVAAAIGPLATPRHLDVASETSVLEAEAWVLAEFGGLDMLANNAGIGGPQVSVHEYPLDDFDRVMAVNVRGLFMVLQAGLRLMLASGGGAIVNTASIGGFRATAGAGAYITSKGAAVMMTRVAALDYATRGIRINAVAPGTVRTPMIEGNDPDFLQMLQRRIPQGRLAEPSDVANVVAFLSDDNEAPHITGQVWLVDGGRSAGG